jgi:hypothetical protein
LRERPVFVVILSPAALASTWVEDETRWAYGFYRKDRARVILRVLAAPVRENDIWVFLQDFKRVEAAGIQPYPPAEAITHTLRALGMKVTPPASAAYSPPGYPPPAQARPAYSAPAYSAPAYSAPAYSAPVHIPPNVHLVRGLFNYPILAIISVLVFALFIVGEIILYPPRSSSDPWLTTAVILICVALFGGLVSAIYAIVQSMRLRLWGWMVGMIVVSIGSFLTLSSVSSLLFSLFAPKE